MKVLLTIDLSDLEVTVRALNLMQTASGNQL